MLNGCPKIQEEEVTHFFFFISDFAKGYDKVSWRKLVDCLRRRLWQSNAGGNADSLRFHLDDSEKGNNSHYIRVRQGAHISCLFFVIVHQ